MVFTGGFGEVGKAFVTIHGNTAPLESEVAKGAAKAAKGAEKALSSIPVSADQVQMQKSFHEVTNAARRAADSSGSAFEGLGRKIAAALGVAAAGRGIFAGVAAAANFEQVQIAFTGLLGSVEAGTAALEKFKKFAAETPFELPGVLRAGQQFIGLGKTVDETLGILGTIGDAAAAIGASGEAINRVTTALGQMEAKGRLSAEELNQIAEVLPNLSRTAIYDQIAAGMGKTREEVSKLAETGQISADQGMAAILRAMQEIPGAAGAMERQSKSLLGIVSTLKDNLRDAAVAGFTPLAKSITGSLGPALESLPKLIGATLTPLGPALAGVFDALTAAFTELSKFLPDIAEAFGTLVGALTPLIPIGSQLINAVLVPMVPLLSALAGIIDTLVNDVPGVTVAIQALAFAFVGMQIGNAIAFIARYTQGLIFMAAASAGTTGATVALGAALRGALTALGPIGIALGVVGLAMAAFGGHSSKSTAELVDFTAALKETGDAAETAIDKILATEFAKGDFIPALEAAGIGIDEMGDALVGLGTGAAGAEAAMDDILRRIAEAEARGELTGEQVDVLTDTWNRLNNSMRDSASTVAKEEKALTALGSSAGQAAVSVETLAKNVDSAVKAQERLTTAQRAEKRASEQLADAREKLNELLAKGAVDADKVKSAEEALAASSDKVTAATDRAAAARKVLEDLLKPATTRELADANQAVEAAQINLERATLTNADAQERFNKLAARAARSTHVSARRQEELTDASLDARAAALDQVNATEQLEDAQAGLNETNNKGKTETDAIVAARKAVADAEKEITASLREQIEAQEELAETKAGDPKFQESVADARQAVADAETNVADAVRDVADAQDELTTAVDLLGGKAETAAESLKKVIDRQLELKNLQPGLLAALQQTLVDLLLSMPSNEQFGVSPFAVMAEGGITGGPGTTPALLHPNEVVIPLTKPRRAMELFEESGLAALVARSGGASGGKQVTINQTVQVPAGVDAAAAANIFNAQVLGALR